MFTEEIIPAMTGMDVEAMLETCHLDASCVELLEQMYGRGNGASILADLLSMGVLIPCDDTKHTEPAMRWYRHHPALVRAIREMAQTTMPSDSDSRRVLAAIDWYEQTGAYERAIKTALQSGEYGRAFELMIDHLYVVLADASSTSLLAWIDNIPAPREQDEYLFALIHAWANFIAGKTKRAHIWLAQAEASPQSVDSSRYRGERFVYETIEIGIFVFNGQYQEAIDLGMSLLDRLGGPQLFLRCTIMHNMGEALVRLGRYHDAYEYFVRARANAAMAGRRVIELLCSSDICWLQFVWGQLDASSNTAMRALASCSEEEKRTLWCIGPLNVALARTYMSWGDLDKALVYLEAALKVLSPKANRDGYLEARVLLARCRRLMNDGEDSYDILAEAYELGGFDRVPRGINLYVLQSYATDLAEGGRLNRARNVLDQAIAQTCDQDAYYHVMELCTKALILHEEGDTESAIEILERAYAMSHDTDMALVETDVVAFLACLNEALGRSASAIELMAQSLSFAADEGHFYPFLRPTPFMGSLLYKMAYPGQTNLAHLSSREKARKFAIEALERRRVVLGDVEVEGPVDGEPLSKREREICALLIQGKTRREIADILGIQLNTVRTHTRSIYKKRSVHSRGELAESMESSQPLSPIAQLPEGDSTRSGDVK